MCSSYFVFPHKGKKWKFFSKIIFFGFLIISETERLWACALPGQSSGYVLSDKLPELFLERYEFAKDTGAILAYVRMIEVYRPSLKENPRYIKAKIEILRLIIGKIEQDQIIISAKRGCIVPVFEIKTGYIFGYLRDGEVRVVLFGADER